MKKGVKKYYLLRSRQITVNYNVAEVHMICFWITNYPNDSAIR
jgi:hypothetical protein